MADSLLTRRILATDHKTVGLQYLFFGLLAFVVGGTLAMVIRWQLAWPGMPVPVLGKLLWPDAPGHAGPMPPEAYNAVFTAHATVMVFYVIIPILTAAFGTYLIPLKIGATNLAFPRVTGGAFWLLVTGGAVLAAGALLAGGPAQAGWTSYVPLAAIPTFPPAAPRGVLRLLQIPGTAWTTVAVAINGVVLLAASAYLAVRVFHLTEIPAGVFAIAAAVFFLRVEQSVAFDGQSCWYLSLLLAGVSSIAAAVNTLTTILTRRCPGMLMYRLPLSVWAWFITALLSLLATPVLAAALSMSLLDHHGLTSFFEPANWILSSVPQTSAGGGMPLVYVHLFWFYSHPAVYIMILPAMGMVSDILSVFSRKPVFGYRPMIWANIAIASLGFLVWGHHMFQSGMNPALGSTFATSTMLIAVPSGIKTFNWLGTLWGGRIRFTVPLLNAVAFVSLFVIGGLSGIFLAATAVDAQLHMTYFVVAHIHYVLFGGSTFGIFAALYFWYPKLFGRMMNPTLGYVHFWMSYVAFNCTFFTMHLLGLQGMPRRLADYRNYAQWAHLQPMNQFITISAFCLGLAQLPLIVNFFGSLVWGRPAPDNPWESATLEWTTSSPPPLENFARQPIVYRGPYEYGDSDHSADWMGQAAAL